MISYYIRVLRLWFYFTVIKMLPGSQLKSVIHHILPNGGTKIPSQKNIEPESDQFPTCNYQLIGNRKKLHDCVKVRFRDMRAQFIRK